MESATRDVLPVRVLSLIAEEHNQCDPKLDELLRILGEHRANECW
jgi:hypothetical protein